MKPRSKQSFYALMEVEPSRSFLLSFRRRLAILNRMAEIHGCDLTLTYLIAILMTCLMVSIPHKGTAQCATPAGTLYPYPYEEPLNDPTELGEPIEINLYLHAVRDDEGEGGVSDAQIEALKESISSYYESRKIYFNYCVVEFNCEECYDGYSELVPYFVTQSLDDGLNLYVFPLSASHGNRAEDVPSKNAVIEYRGPASVYAHEIGHCLGLLHTFEGSECPSAGLPEEYAWYYVGPTLTYGVDCDELGDQICDTPPDLKDCVTATTCEYFENPENLEDIYDHEYIDPDNILRKNIMSYYLCALTDFTDGQETKMREILDLAEELEGVVSPFSHIERVTGAETWDSPLQFNHDIFLESSANLTIEAKVSFTPGHGIIMEAGSQLALDGGELTVSEEETSCPSTTGSLWKGIGVMRQESGPYCIVEASNDAVIEHADRAVYGIGKGRQWTLFYNTEFRNNKISFESVNLTAGATVFQTSDFIVDDDYKLNSYYPQISLIHSSPVSFRGCTFDFQIDEPYAYSRQAIQSYDSHVIVTKWGLTRGAFNNWTEGVSAFSNIGSRLTYVRDANFDGNFKGVQTRFFFRTTVTKNIFDLSNVDIASSAYGIFSQQSRSILFNDNDFLSTDDDVTSTGILVGQTFGEPLTIMDNTFTALNVGIQGESVGISARGMMFRCNENDGNRDFDFDIEGGVGPIQGFDNKPAGNGFSHTAGTTFSDFRLTDVPYLVYYYFKLGATDETPEDYSPELVPISTTGSAGCGSTPFALDPLDAESIEEYEYVKGSIEGQIDDLVEDKEDLLDGGDTPAMISLIESTSGSDPSYVTSRAAGVGPWLSLEAGAVFLDYISNFSEAQIVSVIASSPFILNDVEIYDFVFGGSSPLSAGAKSTIKAAVDAGDSRTDMEAEIEVLSIQLNVNTNSAVSYVLLQDSIDYELVREVLAWKEDFQTEVAIAETYMDEGDYEEAIDYLDGVSGRISLSNEEEDDLEDFITLTQMLINVYNDDRYEGELTSLEIDTLEEIADNGVGFSRGKACSIVSFFYAYDCDEEEAPLISFEHPRFLATDVTHSQVVVFPNPATDEIIIDLTSVEVTKGMLQMYHCDGRIVRELEIPALTFKLKMSIADLEDGVYLLRVLDEGSELYSGKIIKQ